MTKISELTPGQIGYVSPDDIRAFHWGNGELDLKISPHAQVQNQQSEDFPIMIASEPPDHNGNPIWDTPIWVTASMAERNLVGLFIDYENRTVAYHIVGTLVITLQDGEETKTKDLQIDLVVPAYNEQGAIFRAVEKAIPRQDSMHLVDFDWAEGPTCEGLTIAPLS